MEVIFKTNIDNYKGKFPDNFSRPPAVGDYVCVDPCYKDLPFNKLQVVSVTYIDNYTVEVELHLSETQSKQANAYNLNVFG